MKSQTQCSVSVLPSQAHNVATAMIQASSAFLEKLCKWITQENIDLVGLGGSKEDVWKLMSHCVRAIFKELHKARIAGRGPFFGNKAGSIAWGSLRAQKRMKEFLNKKFMGDPALSHILNLYLQDNAVM